MNEHFYSAAQKFLSFCVGVVLLVSLVQPTDAAAAPSTAPTLAADSSAATGTAGSFVPVQERVFDDQTVADQWRTVQVAGVGSVPSEGISSVQLTVTMVTPSSIGNVFVMPSSSSSTSVPALVYKSGISGSISATTIVAVGSDGKIKVKAQSAERLILDVQGIYTSGDGVAAGGYVPIQPRRIADSRSNTNGLLNGSLVKNTTYNLPVAGSSYSGVPTGASAAFVTLIPISSDSVAGFLKPRAGGDPAPNISLNFPGNMATAIGTTVPLAADGSFDVHFNSGGGPIHLAIDVIGYFTATDGQTGAFTPAAARVLDTRKTPYVAIPANGTASFPLAGIKGVPAAGAGISAVAVSMTAIHTGTNSGRVVMWNADAPQPNTTVVNYPAVSATRSNMTVVAPSADGKINIRNIGNDQIHVILDVYGWYSNVTAPIQNGQTRTQARTTLQAGAAGGDWVSYEYRRGTVAPFGTVPVAQVTVPGTTTHPSSWPVQRTSAGQFDRYTWDVAATVGNTEGLIQIRACYGTSATDTAPVCSAPSNLQLATKTFGATFATRDIGPGTLSLLTGDYRVSESDVDIATPLGALTVGRDFTTLASPTERPGPQGVFGPGWTAAFVGPDAGAGSLYLNDETATAGFVTIEDSDGYASVFQATTPTSIYPISFAGLGDEAAIGWTVTKTSATQFTVVDEAGTTTTWTKATTGWNVTSVREAASPSSTTYIRDSNGLPTRILAPVPAGVTCTNPDTTPGCRSLVFTYAAVSTGSGTATRISRIDYRAYDPATAAMKSVQVAEFTYTGSGGRLSSFADPRTNRTIGANPIPQPLRTLYTYDTSGRLKTLTPPGLAAWTVNYDTGGRIASVTRPDPSGPTAVNTVVYDVPVTGGAAPIELSAAATASWGQTEDLPVTGTAIFAPNKIPAGGTPSTVTGADWPYADLAYVDVNGREVNSATHGAGAWQISTTQYDDNGNSTWELSTGNRAQALSVSPDTAPSVAAETNSANRAQLLADITVYHPTEPSLVTDTFGPMHPVVLTDDSTIDARTHVKNVYDEGAPDSDIAYNLMTTSVVSARDSDGNDHDATVTRSGYEAINSGDPTGWDLRIPTTSTSQMGDAPDPAADLTTTNRYNALAQLIESRSAAGAAGGDARTTLTTYYTATGTGTCMNAAFAGLACKTAPAAQPASGPTIPSSTFQYDQFARPTKTIETSGSTVRTTTTAYDIAGRESSGSVTVTPAGTGGTSIPSYSIGLDTNTGLPLTRTAGGQTLTTTYDSLGRVTSYTDAGGTVSQTSYDIAGRTASEGDGKGTSTYTYDTATEHRDLVTQLVDDQAGTFSVVYDADGNSKTTTYPGGLEGWNRYDNAGNHREVNYAKNNAAIYTNKATYDANARVRATTSDQSAQVYTYDLPGRLIKVNDLAMGGTCTTRLYDLDRDGNRQSLTTYPSTNSTCSEASTPAVENFAYDSFSRVTDSGYSYDTLGRTLTIPARHAKGIGASNSLIEGDLSVAYHVNDMVASQGQGSSTRTFSLDPMRDRIALVVKGSKVTTNHFSGDGDSPSWVESGGTWERFVGGPDGGLAATTTASSVALNLADLRGNIIASMSPTASTLTDTSESTEFGAPRSAATSTSPYGWKGSAQRSTDTLGGLTLMGVRLYDAMTGRFLSPDPVTGGNTTPYNYPTDPISQEDLNGQWWVWSWLKRNPAKPCTCSWWGGRFGGHVKSFGDLFRKPSYATHRKNARKSTSDKHQSADDRRDRDQGQARARKSGKVQPNPNTANKRAKQQQDRNRRLGFAMRWSFMRWA